MNLIITKLGVTSAWAKNINKQQSRELRLPTEQGVTFACAKKIINC